MKKIPLKLKLVMEKALYLDKDKKKAVSRDMRTGEEMYIRNDLSGLQQLLTKFDTRMNDMKAWKMWTKVKDKLTDCYLNDKKWIELSLDEAIFLKDFLIDLLEKNTRDSKLPKEEKIIFKEYETRTLLGIIDQFDEKT